MKLIIVFAAVLAVALAADADTTIVEESNAIEVNGEYSFTTKLSDGTIRHEEGKLAEVGSETEHLEITGYFEFQTPDGTKIHTDYTAGTKGFEATGDHIPKVETPAK